MAQQHFPQIDFIIQKVFTADASFEAPDTPATFKNTWEPEANIELNTDNQKLDDGNYLVNLMITVTAKNQKDTAFIAEVKQSGIFGIKGAETPQLNQILGAYCPGTLFPYAREAIAGLVSRGGFPQLNLAPINFEALYAQQAAQQSEGNSQAK